MQATLGSRIAQKMDSESSAFSTEGSFLSVLCIVAVFLGVVGLAMVLVTVRRCVVTDSEVEVLSTDQPQPLPPPEVIGRWVPVGVMPVTRRPYRTRFVTVIVRNNIGMMPIFVELKEWRIVLAIKLHIYYVTGYLLTHQRLTHHGEILDDYCQLDDYGWYNGRCVELKVDFLVSL